MRTALLILITAFLSPSCGLAALNFHFAPTLILSNSLIRELTSTLSFIPFSGKLWNFLPAPVFPSSYDLTSFKRKVSFG
ncbi:hypothetical protein E2C01_018047 [Portunus trituberculatus]|uniref:Uncharacterized protein n=1 Tax=Portunus trituberculatus TaxID=210409 RepID=A0A5B7DVF5_PORTR|nr:hypothetical protein [Portunus trituberculatus]